MPTFEARPHAIKLSNDQADELGINDRSKLLGCGTNACAYVNDDGDVVKLTKDVRDAFASYLIMGMPKSQRKWAIPIYDVYRLPDGYYAIVAAKARPISDKLANAIDDIYTVAQKMDTQEDEADVFYDTLFQDYRQQHSGFALDALNYVQEAVDGFRNMGLDWADYHSGNWGMYDRRPVVIDLGMSQPLTKLPIPQLTERHYNSPFAKQTRALQEALLDAPNI